MYPVHSLFSTNIPIRGHKVIEIKLLKKYCALSCYKMKWIGKTDALHTSQNEFCSKS